MRQLTFALLTLGLAAAVRAQSVVGSPGTPANSSLPGATEQPGGPLPSAPNPVGVFQSGASPDLAPTPAGTAPYQANGAVTDGGSSIAPYPGGASALASPPAPLSPPPAQPTTPLAVPQTANPVQEISPYSPYDSYRPYAPTTPRGTGATSVPGTIPMETPGQPVPGQLVNP